MIVIKMNPDDMAKVQSMLAEIKNAGSKVISRAINKTLTGVKTDASTEIRSVITAKKSAVDGTFQITKATVTDLRGVFASSGRPLPLMDYSARQTKKGVSVQVKKTGTRTVIAGTFISTMKSGHKGVFWRQWHGGKRSPKKKIAYARLPKMYRMPIEERFGPRIPDYLGDKGPVMGRLLAKTDERLHKNMASELNFELSKL